MKIISFITDQQVIRQMLKHLSLWTQTSSRDPPNTTSSPKNNELVYELFDDLSAFDEQADGWHGCDEDPVSCQTELFVLCHLLQETGIVCLFPGNPIQKIG